MLNFKNFRLNLKNLIILSVCLIIFIVFLIIYKIGFLSFIRKILGIFLIMLGLIITVKAPQPGDYQPERFARIFIVIGVFILLFGVYLLGF